VRQAILALVTTAVLVACRPTTADHPDLPPPPEPALTAEEETELQELEAALATSPDDSAAHRRAGLAYMWLTLSGHHSMREKAETHLERAFELDPDDNTVTRSLGRFYNMRTVAGDYAKAEMQVKAYHALLGDTPPLEMSHRGFVAWTFFQMGRALTAYNRGKLIRALRTVRVLEKTLKKRVEKDPTNVELRALAGNFAFFFAGNLPTRKRTRVRTGVEHFDYARANWERMRKGARDPVHCPNTYENFMFELAEGHLILKQLDAARSIYEELAQSREPLNPAREQVAALSRERLDNLEAYAGDMGLMPPWPSDEANCVVCHAGRAEVSERTLYRLATP
jgi:tetratricopeptide (TPR) repeat protein